MQNFPLWKQILILGICVARHPRRAAERLLRPRRARQRRPRGDGGAARRRRRSCWPTPPAGRRCLPSRLINLGLDLRGGAHVLVQVETADVYTERMEGLWPMLRDRLRDLRDQVGTVRRLDGPPDELHIRVGNPAGVDAALAGGAGGGAAGLLADRRLEPRVRRARRGRHAGRDADRGREGGDRRAAPCSRASRSSAAASTRPAPASRRSSARAPTASSCRCRASARPRSCWR